MCLYTQSISIILKIPNVNLFTLFIQCILKILKGIVQLLIKEIKKSLEFLELTGLINAEL